MPASSHRDSFCDKSHLPQVAALKRVFELWMLDRDFHDAYLADPVHALEGTGLEVDQHAVSLLLLGGAREARGSDPLAELPETYVWYRDYVAERYRRNHVERAGNLPDDPRFRDWILRQLRRCEREMGVRGRFITHIPLAFELTSGCSVGCSFCALSAGRLKGVFRHTGENVTLWRDALARLHKVVGDAAGRGLCYYATEPLDNLDYELFLRDFFDEFGRIPQTTTAAATRNVERTRRLLRWGQETYEHFDRISVLGSHELDAILAAFSPEELVFTDLLPQFAEAPACNLTKAGRNRGEDQESGGTIACVSGFVVNMWEHSVRLVTPVPASDEHPTGEQVYERSSFTDGASLEEAVVGMIDRHMHETIGLFDVLGAGR